MKRNNNLINFNKIQQNINKIFYLHNYKEDSHCYLIKQLKINLIKKQLFLYHPIGGSNILPYLLNCLLKNNYFYGIIEINMFYKIYLKYNTFGNSIISNITAIPIKQFKNNYLSLLELSNIKGMTYILSVPSKGIITHNDALSFKKSGHTILKIIP